MMAVILRIPTEASKELASLCYYVLLAYCYQSYIVEQSLTNLPDKLRYYVQACRMGALRKAGLVGARVVVAYVVYKDTYAGP